MDAAARFYFSFRSPYAWLAALRVTEEALPVEAIPVAGMPSSANFADPAANPAKRRYLVEDIGRLASARGIKVRWPKAVDTDWIKPHALFEWAKAQGQGEAALLALFAARFQRGEDLGEDGVLQAVAAGLGFQADAPARAVADPAVQARLAGYMDDLARDGVFGVPFFVWNGQHFWGQDRIDALKAALNTAARPAS